MSGEGGNEETQTQRGRYYAEFVQAGVGSEPYERVQVVLDMGAERGWRLVAASGGLSGGGVILYWDTQEGEAP